MFSVCYISANSHQLAEKLARHLVTLKLAACVNIIPQVQSVYEWKGEVVVDTEHLLMVKTKSSLVPELIEEVKRNHPFEVPEIISVPMGEGSAKYLEWVSTTTK